MAVENCLHPQDFVDNFDWNHKQLRSIVDTSKAQGSLPGLVKVGDILPNVLPKLPKKPARQS